MRSELTLSVNISESKLLPLLHGFIDQMLENISNESHNHYQLELFRTNNIKISPNGRSFQINAVFNGEVSGRGLLKKAKATGQVSVDIIATYQMYDQNKLQLDTRIIDVCWVEAPKFHLGIGKMSIKKVANLLLSNIVNKTTIRFDELAKERIDLSKLLETYFSGVKIIPIPINDQLLYLNVDELLILISDINLKNNIFVFLLHIDSKTLIKDNNSIEKLKTTDIQRVMSIKLMDNTIAKNNKLIIPLHLSYDFLNVFLLKKVTGRTFDILNKKIVITDIEISNLDGKKVFLQIKTNEKILEWIEISFIPVFDKHEQAINLENLHIKLKKTNFLGRSLMLADNLIEKIVLKKINPILLKPVLSEIENTINMKIQEESIKHGLLVDLDQQGILIESLSFNNDYLEIEVSNMLDVNISTKVI